MRTSTDWIAIGTCLEEVRRRGDERRRAKAAFANAEAALLLIARVALDAGAQKQDVAKEARISRQTLDAWLKKEQGAIDALKCENALSRKGTS